VKRALVAALLVLTLFACAGNIEEAVTRPTEGPTVPASARAARPDDPEVRAGVLDELEDFNDDHGELLEAYESAFGPLPPDDQRVTEGIDRACAAASRDFAPSDDEAGIIAMFFGRALLESGSDVPTYMNELRERDRRIADLVGC
jgi:hypothetical protein